MFSINVVLEDGEHVMAICRGILDMTYGHVLS